MLSTHSNFPPAFKHLSFSTAIDRSVSFFSISCNSCSQETSSSFIADTSFDNSFVLRRNCLVSVDMVVSIVSSSPESKQNIRKPKIFRWNGVWQKKKEKEEKRENKRKEGRNNVVSFLETN